MLVIASLPLLRPIFRKVIPGSFLSSTRSRSRSYPTVTHFSDVRTTRRSKPSRTTEVEESSSQHQLSDMERGPLDLESVPTNTSPEFRTVTWSPLRGSRLSLDTEEEDDTYVPERDRSTREPGVP